MAWRTGNGAAAYVNVFATLPVSSGSYTIIGSGVIKVNRAASARMFCLLRGSGLDYHTIETNASGTAIFLNCNGNTTSAISIGLNTPFFWAVKVSGASSALFVRNYGAVTITKVTGTGTTFAVDQLLLGDTSFNEWFDGELGSVIVYNSALADVDVEAQLGVQTPIVAGYAAWYPTVGTTVADQLVDASGNGYNLTNSAGAVTVVPNWASDPSTTPAWQRFYGRGGSRDLVRMNAFVPTSKSSGLAGVNALFGTAVSGTSYIITPTGSITFDGTSSFTLGVQYNPTGTITFTGTTALIKEQIYLPTGNITFNGTNTALYSRQIIPSGDITFSGTTTFARGSLFTPTGAITFTGASPFIINKVYLPTGSVDFTGTAPMTFSGSTSYIITPSGGIDFDGTNEFVKSITYSPTGSIDFSGNALFQYGYQIPASGAITFTGTSIMTFTPGGGGISYPTKVPMTNAGIT